MFPIRAPGCIRRSTCLVAIYREYIVVAPGPPGTGLIVPIVRIETLGEVEYARAVDTQPRATGIPDRAVPIEDQRVVIAPPIHADQVGKWAVAPR